MEKLAPRPAKVTRTMVGLRNLQVFRGHFAVPGVDLQQMMVGPCHFYGTLPSDSGVTSYRLVLTSAMLPGPGAEASRRPEYRPLRGGGRAQEVLDAQHIAAMGKPPPPSALTLAGHFSDRARPGTTLTAGSSHTTGIFVVEDWSLAGGPGAEVPAPAAGARPACVAEVHDATAYNLEPFGAQVVKNGDEFGIPGILTDQDDLQLITYWWGEDYLEHAMHHDDGAFLETHDFPQTVTPLSEDCGGHILLARPATRDSMQATVEVVAVYVPFGYTMILGKNAWHGDAGLRGLHLMAMTANHLIMEGTTKSWFMKHDHPRGDPTGKVDMGDEPRLQALENFKYKARYWAGARERPQTALAIPAELPRLVCGADRLPNGAANGKVRHERWDSWVDEGLRKYAPWASPATDSWAPAPAPGEDEAYVEHQRDLAHRFAHATRCKTVGPIGPLWMLRAPRAGHWRYRLGIVTGATLAGDACFAVENLWSDCTVDDLLSSIPAGVDEGRSLEIVSPVPDSQVLRRSDILMDHCLEPRASDGAGELALTVVIGKESRTMARLRELERLHPHFERRPAPILRICGFTILSK